jgi:hypothetical protein
MLMCITIPGIPDEKGAPCKKMTERPVARHAHRGVSYSKAFAEQHSGLSAAQVCGQRPLRARSH